MLEANGAGMRHALHLEMPWVLEGRQQRGKRPSRGDIARRRRIALQGRMRSLFIVLAAKRIERTLLPPQILRRRPRGVGFQCPMHPLYRDGRADRRSATVPSRVELESMDLDLEGDPSACGEP